MDETFENLNREYQVVFLRAQIVELYIEIQNYIKYSDYLIQKTKYNQQPSYTGIISSFASNVYNYFVNSVKENVETVLKKELESISDELEPLVNSINDNMILTINLNYEKEMKQFIELQKRVESLKSDKRFEVSFFNKYFVSGYEEVMTFSTGETRVENNLKIAVKILNNLNKEYVKLVKYLENLSERRLEEIKRVTSKLGKKASEEVVTNSKLSTIKKLPNCNVLSTPSLKDFEMMFRDDITFLVTTVPSVLDKISSETKSKAIYGFVFDAITKFSNLFPERNIRYDFTKEDLLRIPGIQKNVVEYHATYNGLNSLAGKNLVYESKNYFEKADPFPMKRPKDLIGIYVGNKYYKYVNAFLRKIPNEFSPLPDRLVEPLNGLINYMYKSPRTKIPLVVRRCVSEMDIVVEREGFPKEDPLKWVGLTFEESAFLSTSKYIHPSFCARGNVGRPPILFLIWVPSGCCAISTIPLDINVKEREVLFPPKTSVFVASADLVDLPKVVSNLMFNKTEKHPEKIYVLRCFISCQNTPKNIEELLKDDRELLKFLPENVSKKFEYLFKDKTLSSPTLKSPSKTPRSSISFPIKTKPKTKPKSEEKQSNLATPPPLILSPVVIFDKMDVDEDDMDTTTTNKVKDIENEIFYGIEKMSVDTPYNVLEEIKEERANRIKNVIKKELETYWWIPYETINNIPNFFKSIASIYSPSFDNFSIEEADLKIRNVSLLLCEIAITYSLALSSPSFFENLEYIMNKFNYEDPLFSRFKEDKNSLEFYILVFAFRLVHQALVEKSFIPLLQLKRVTCFDKGFTNASQVSDWASKTVLDNLYILNNFITNYGGFSQVSLEQIKEYLTITLKTAPYGEECDQAYISSYENEKTTPLLPPNDVFRTREILSETAKTVLVTQDVIKRDIKDEIIVFYETTVKNFPEINILSSLPEPEYKVASKVAFLYNFIIIEIKKYFLTTF